MPHGGVKQVKTTDVFDNGIVVKELSLRTRRKNMKQLFSKWVLSMLVLAISAVAGAETPQKMDPPSREFLGTSQLLSPPTNIRATPNGKILCVAKKQGGIKIYGSTGVYDDNGEWYYTNYCGRMGVIHGSQFISPG